MADTQKTFLLIADISGYTNFMVTNKTTIAHSQVIITDLLESLLKEIKLPLKVSKLEGDAIFFYGVDKGRLKEKINSKLITLFHAYYRKLHYLTHSNVCDCEASNNINSLKLKLIVHFGDVHFHKVGKFQELSGPDVIIVHRLLKNRTDLNQYILLSETAQK